MHSFWASTTPRERGTYGNAAAASLHRALKDERSIISARLDSAIRRSFDYPNNGGSIVGTRLGNVLRSGELLAGGRYGVDTVVTLPGLEFILPQDRAARLSARRDDV